LLDILDAIEHIEKYAARGREVFNQDELIQNWIIRQLETASSCKFQGGYLKF